MKTVVIVILCLVCFVLCAVVLLLCNLLRYYRWLIYCQERDLKDLSDETEARLAKIRSDIHISLEMIQEGRCLIRERLREDVILN